jgi:hypothetical protein
MLRKISSNHEVHVGAGFKPALTLTPFVLLASSFEKCAERTQDPHPSLSRKRLFRNATNQRRCHAERKRSICFFGGLRKADSSAAPQNDILTQSPSGRGFTSATPWIKKSPRPLRWERARACPGPDPGVRAISLLVDERKIVNHFVVKCHFRLAPAPETQHSDTPVLQPIPLRSLP